MLTDMAKYMNLAGGSNDSVHAPITNIIWWCWNANSAQAFFCMHASLHLNNTYLPYVIESKPRRVELAAAHACTLLAKRICH